MIGMKIIGLAGGIACGKSTVSYHLRELGAHIIDADAIAHALSAPGGAIYELYIDHFGNDILAPDGELDRRAIGAIVFQNPAERAWMDAMVHPMIRRKIIDAIDVARACGTKAVILDIPLLFEVGWQDLADENWVVMVKEKIQLARLMKRNGFTKQEALERIRAQMPLEEKCRLADVVIDNSKHIEGTYVQVDALWRERVDG